MAAWRRRTRYYAVPQLNRRLVSGRIVEIMVACKDGGGPDTWGRFNAGGARPVTSPTSSLSLYAMFPAAAESMAEATA